MGLSVSHHRVNFQAPLRSKPVRNEQKPESKPSSQEAAKEPWTRQLASEFITTGLKYVIDKNLAIAQSKFGGGLKKSPSAKVKKPVLLIQGFKGGLHQFTPMVEHLEASGNGTACYIKDGGAFADRTCSERFQPDEQTKIFHLVHDDEASPEIIADDIEAATKLIKNVTRSERPDVIAHSMAGLATRIFTDRGGKIGKMALVGTPNKGSRMSGITHTALLNGISWAASLSAISAAAIPALEWMIPVESGNEKLRKLNERWDHQQENTQGALLIGAGDFKTASTSETWERGDGLIEESRLAVGDLEVRSLKGKGRKCHFTQLSEPEIYKELSQFLEWNLAEAQS